MTSGIGGDGKERIVTAARCMNDRDTVDRARLDATASRPLEYYNHGFRKPSRSRAATNSSHERSNYAWPIPPPAIRARPDHIRRIDEKHGPSLHLLFGGSTFCSLESRHGSRRGIRTKPR